MTVIVNKVSESGIRESRVVLSTISEKKSEDTDGDLWGNLTLFRLKFQFFLSFPEYSFQFY